MKLLNSVMVTLILIVGFCSNSILYSYSERRLGPGENPRPTVEYLRISLEDNGVYVRYAVDLTPKERYALQDAIKKNIKSDTDYNKRIDQEFIRLILSGCQKRYSNYCNVIEKVLGDFMNKSVDALFTGVGLSRDI